MTNLIYLPLPTDRVRALQRGGPDAHGNVPEIHVSDGNGVPCRHCLKDVPKGEEYLILSYKPFEEDQPYAEQGPIFLHARECEAYDNQHELPKLYERRAGMLLRGYDSTNRIVYGTGLTARPKEIKEAAEQLLAREDIAYVHARSPTNNCYHFRIEFER
jgi:hypothetical protein